MELEKITDSKIKKLVGKNIQLKVDHEEYSGRLISFDDSCQLIYRKDPMTIVQTIMVSPEDLFKQNGSFVLKTKNPLKTFYYYPTSLHYKELDKILSQ